MAGFKPVGIDADGKLPPRARAALDLAYLNVLGTASNPITSASAARPTGLTVVHWRCATQPTNWVSGDVWTVA